MKKLITDAAAAAPAPAMLKAVMGYLGRRGGSRKVPKGLATMSKAERLRIQTAGTKAAAVKRSQQAAERRAIRLAAKVA